MRTPTTLLISTLAFASQSACGGTENSTDTAQPTGGITTAGSDGTLSATSGVDSDSVDSSASDGSSTGKLTCGEATFVLDAVPPNVVLVLDKSGSMVLNSWDADADPGTPDETRWQSLHDVVDFIVNAFDAKVNFGALLFPSTAATNTLTAGACVVSGSPEVAVNPLNSAAILAGIPAANAGSSAIRGATPAATAIQVARTHLLSLDPSVDRFVILVTDGAANCGAQYSCSGQGCGLFENYDEDLPVFVGQMYNEDDIPTFVVGIDILDEMIGTDPNDAVPAANTFDELNTVAEAGGRARVGTEKFFNAINEVELMAALQEIAGQVVSCTIPLDPEPDFPEYVDVVVGGVTLDRVSDCETEDGWVFVNPEGPYNAIELCGSACQALAEQGTLDAEYGCPPPA